MTDLTKAIKRKTDIETANLRTKRMVVTLYPNSTIGIREHRKRKEYRIPLATVYSMAVKAESLDRARAKAKEKADRKQARRAGQ